MIDTGLGPTRVNNFLTTLNMKPINHRNLKKMERRAGAAVEEVAEESARRAAKAAFDQEMMYDIYILIFNIILENIICVSYCAICDFV